MAWQKGQTGNPHGRPSVGQSWSEIIKTITDLTSEELIEMVGGPDSVFGRKLVSMPPKVQLKNLLAISAITELINAPQANMLMAVMDRTDGKPVVPVESRNDLRVRITTDASAGQEVIAQEEEDA